MFVRITRFAAWICALLWAGNAWAQWPPLDDIPAIEPTGSGDVAIIVAIEDYLLLPSVPGAIANANEWEVFLRNGMKVRDVHVLANQDATRESMLKFAKTAAADVGEGGTIWWIFVGHGAPTVDGQDGLLVGMDAQKTVESLEARGLAQGQLLNTLQSSNHKTVLVLDASFSGRAADGSALAAGVQPVVAVQSANYLLANTVMLSASKATETAGSLDGAPRPAFSYLMLGALRGWADANDGSVTAAEALYYTQRELRKIKGRQQTPQIVGDVTLVLSRGVSEDKPRVVAEGIAPEVKPEEARPVVASGAPSDAALTLEYLQRRIVYEGSVPRQAGRILDGPAFYHAIGRADLAAKWKSHKPVMWGTGIGLLVVSSIGLGVGVATDTTGGIVGGGVAGGLGIIGGTLAIIFGFVGEHHPMSMAQRKLAVRQFNEKLREQRGLGPEVDWQDQPDTRGPWGYIQGSSAPVFGFRLRF